ncbi:uncharacterized protein BYT42DRAFT_618554 [Radiomyces spectabilis]|uniref:uncharacterized protein n=1 Tax=Radiomyces spectabilis TaxID=64574 RepID=UPI002220C661|nr:uncharacterized protein BYT42DRAFT_618554 [Radiomyces spectabilis]KAI8366119.1 hypothetical protein BYT42DRAFT_618554 [Radiomyces spectabilis]
MLANIASRAPAPSPPRCRSMTHISMSPTPEPSIPAIPSTPPSPLALVASEEVQVSRPAAADYFSDDNSVSSLDSDLVAALHNDTQQRRLQHSQPNNRTMSPASIDSRIQQWLDYSRQPDAPSAHVPTALVPAAGTTVLATSLPTPMNCSTAETHDVTTEHIPSIAPSPADELMSSPIAAPTTFLPSHAAPSTLMHLRYSHGGPTIPGFTLLQWLKKLSKPMPVF